VSGLRRKDLSKHYDQVIHSLKGGRLLPFLGAGASLCGPGASRLGAKPGSPVQQHLPFPNAGGGQGAAGSPSQGEAPPSGWQLASYLAGKVAYPPECVASRSDTRAGLNLLEVAQHFEILNDELSLYDTLHEVFDRDFAFSPVHEFLARLPSVLKAKKWNYPHQFIVSTNYDDLMERAFRALPDPEPCDLVVYDAKEGSTSGGRFLYIAPGAAPVVVDVPQTFLLPVGERSVILKIHGAVARNSKPEQDSYVITEDHYFDYPFYNEIPINLRQEFVNRRFLFLGYSLSDWNVRMIFRRISKEHVLSKTAWTVTNKHDPLQKMIWENRGVEYIVADLADYVHDLEIKLSAS